MIYIEDVLASFEHNTTCSLGRDTLLALVLVILSFGIEALHLEDYLWHMHGAFYHWKVLQLGFDKLILDL
jgi:hypothetical protein